MENFSHTYHAKLQEMCDCFMDTDYVAELDRAIDVQSATLEEEAFRYFALAILYTLTIKAQKLSVTRKNGVVKVAAHTLPEKKILPPPPVEIADKMFEIIRGITHLDADKGEMPLALGLRGDQVDLQVKVKRSDGEETMKLLYPDLGD